MPAIAAGIGHNGGPSLAWDLPKPRLRLPKFEPWRILRPLKMFDGQFYPFQPLQFLEGLLAPSIGAHGKFPTTCLLHFDGANASQVFIDSSFNHLPFTVAGNAQLDTSTSVFGTASGLFDGTGDYIYSDDASAFLMPANFTVEGRVRCTNETTASRPLFDTRGAGGGIGLYLYLNSSESLVLAINVGGSDLTKQTSATLTAGTWYSWAICRSSGTWRAFLNGTEFGSSFSDSTNFTGQKLTIGAFIDTRDATGPNNKFKGNMDEFRFSPTTGRYTANYTPSGSAFGPTG